MQKTQSKNKRLIDQRSKFLLTGSIIAIIIAFSPYLFYIYEIFPDGPVWENSLFTYKSNYYENVMTAMWTYFGKITPLILLLIWFFTCKHWWYHVILIPIGMYLFQLIMAINDDVKFSDEIEIWYLVPIMAVIVPLVYLIRAKIFASMHNPTLEEIEYELQNKKNIFTHFRDLFRN